ncbi:MAG: aspartate kinase [Elusimicrobia bacterium CG1_02_63_36]|nr:MAG: aspartate kinase [Elusimicrobia bacterium CG1_02_63_36]PIP82184.1 MAG: aspartate kinase [Elusimicrobia bacterium CG22_combo_CG10-13_8_21_14_all_63_91]PJA17999.1 MAG: aspartate kinase [Elusimicrobia bacterium CG_4_10_14_0_2_um_filter_63_34]PJB24219.1 MAG: aspartate kinase [Elusimicrobia bacterium CG_4_9_14_3_um_filter_62_55]
MGTIVAKFGGTSLADGQQFAKVVRIIKEDPDRRFIVPSAPGRSKVHDHKVTDLLYLCHSHVAQSLPFDDVFGHVAERYKLIISELGVKLDLGPKLREIRTRIKGGASSDYAASRGEYLSGTVLAALLDVPFVDPAEVIRFGEDGRLDADATQRLMEKRLGPLDGAVVPGFYGSKPDGEICVFSRGGSDVTGALVARGVDADVYENWTDVSGLRMADPRIVPNPERIDTLTYRELRELSYMGASVLHDEAVFPVRLAGIPVHIRNTNNSKDEGTKIVHEAAPSDRNGGLSGIAGKRDFTVIALEKALMNQELGFGRRVLDVIADHGISYEHTPTGIDSLSVVIDSRQLDGKLNAVVSDLKAQCRPDVLEVYPNMALIAVVGRAMAHRPGVAARVFASLADERINVRMIDQGSSEINIILGVETRDFERSVRAIYRAFLGK